MFTHVRLYIITFTWKSENFLSHPPLYIEVEAEPVT